MSLHDNLTRDGLVRPIEGRVLGGVCAGLGRRFGLEPWPTRLLFILVLMVIPGSQLLIYPILWILMPSETRYAYYPAYGPPAGDQAQYATAQYPTAQYPTSQYAPVPPAPEQPQA